MNVSTACIFLWYRILAIKMKQWIVSIIDWFLSKLWYLERYAAYNHCDLHLWPLYYHPSLWHLYYHPRRRWRQMTICSSSVHWHIGFKLCHILQTLRTSYPILLHWCILYFWCGSTPGNLLDISFEYCPFILPPPQHYCALIQVCALHWE